MTRAIPLTEAQNLPLWQRPKTLLFVMAAAMPLAFATWQALLNNFVTEMAGFDGSHIGWLHSLREIPGLLSFSVIFILLIMREQLLAMLSLILLGGATALMGYFPSLGGIMLLTLLSSIGFHVFETVNQSLQQQWLNKAEAPKVMGKLIAAGSAATFLAYGCVKLSWNALGLTYQSAYMTAGCATIILAVIALIAYPKFNAPHPQRKKLLLRRRYWLYYALQFMSGARRQIFVVFAAFMMVERFGYAVDEITGLLLATLAINILVAPVFGRAVAAFGERTALILEYTGLFGIFVAYAGIYYLEWGPTTGAILYVLNHLFFSLALAIKTYFQKIADPADIAPTAGVAFAINHIAAVFLPALLGYVWLTSPGSVFLLAATMALVSLGLSLLIPRHPGPGRETIFAKSDLTPDAPPQAAPN